MSLHVGELRGEAGGRRSSLIWRLGPVWGGEEEEEGRGGEDPSVQIPARKPIPGLGSGSCLFHGEHQGPEQQGHSEAPQGPQESSAARLRVGPTGRRVPTGHVQNKPMNS